MLSRWRITFSRVVAAGEKAADWSADTAIAGLVLVTD